jgi:hypothetical protein
VSNLDRYLEVPHHRTRFNNFFLVARGTIEPWVKDLKQLLGLGQYQNRSNRAAVIHLPLVCFADALLTHLRIERTGAQGQRKRDKTADRATAATQYQLRRLVWDDLVAPGFPVIRKRIFWYQLRWLVWDDLVTSLKEKPQDQSVLAELERLRVARSRSKSANLSALAGVKEANLRSVLTDVFRSLASPRRRSALGRRRGRPLSRYAGAPKRPPSGTRYAGGIVTLATSKSRSFVMAPLLTSTLYSALGD